MRKIMPKALTLDCLSEHDRQVLESVFNPLDYAGNFDGAILPDASAELQDIEDNPDAENVKKAKNLELEAIKTSEIDGKLAEALKLFEKVISLAPERASSYNNRAQALRLAGQDEAAMNDLNKAIDLGAKQLRTKCHAHCQRGVLYRKQENIEAARSDFEEAAKLGSKFAKTQLVEINPYAALCNQMLRKAFEELK